ncbi:MAG: HEPN domain-containing protein [Mediterranea massiliensis]|nr:HEPN domain-containing protein [Mediterranea massiliensis]
MTEQQRIDIVTYRIGNAVNTLDEIKEHISNEFYNTAVNRMYYACFYAVSALLVAHQIEVKSHDGTRQMFGRHFVLTGIVPKELGRFYRIIFEKRSSGDYEDFINYDLETVNSLYPETCRFVIFIKGLVDAWLTK